MEQNPEQLAAISEYPLEDIEVQSANDLLDPDKAEAAEKTLRAITQIKEAASQEDRHAAIMQALTKSIIPTNVAAKLLGASALAHKQTSTPEQPPENPTEQHPSEN